LGLSICNSLVHLMGGSIWVESEVNRGSEFHFTISARVGRTDAMPSAPFEVEARSTSPAAPLGRPDIQVLVAEDNPANRKLARLTLEKFGVRVFEASNGVEALSAARRFRLDAILMDCRMPVMDGYEATRRIRALPDPAGRVPIIALTASAFHEDRLRAEQAGMNDFVAKPFNDLELVRKCFALMKSAAAVPVPSPGETAAASGSFDGHPPDLVREVMTIFLETAPPIFERLVASAQAGDWETARASAHWLRGGATRLIAPALQEQLGHIETVCASAQPSLSESELDSLSRAFQNAYRTADLWLSQAQANAACARA
jgi:CheY-like chemotaxis protein